jgi:hypothetical protein
MPPTPKHVRRLSQIRTLREGVTPTTKPPVLGSAADGKIDPKSPSDIMVEILAVAENKAMEPELRLQNIVLMLRKAMTPAPQPSLAESLRHPGLANARRRHAVAAAPANVNRHVQQAVADLVRPTGVAVTTLLESQRTPTTKAASKVPRLVKARR